MSSPEELAAAYLGHVVEGPSRALQRHLDAGRDLVEIAEAVRRRAPWLGALLSETEARHDYDAERDDLAAARAVGARLIYPGHDEWPAARLDQAFGFAARGISPHLRSYEEDAAAPHALWVRGARLDRLSARSVALVGARRPGRYGNQAAAHLARSLAARGLAVVSGGASGIDAIAHRSALSAGGATVAVLACGVDRAHPAHHRRLLDEVAARGGAVVSEYPPGSPPQRHRFLTRNRLIAALAPGVVAVEAAPRSGAINVLTWAAGLGRVPMVAPGPLTEPGFRGGHEKVAAGEAQLVVDADDVRCLVGAIDGGAPAANGPGGAPRLSRTELRVFDALHPTGRLGTRRVAACAGLPERLAASALVSLTRRGLVCPEPEGWRRAGALPSLGR
ncbi:DNA-processing protein DprA [Corynebacterium otitidis]|uniref:DNA-processing protein DprA n=1 Tax=Corynebacterium otitidis TaxID=29321 RepID=UPI000627AD72|nr:DNA-processing protein DprA [Corynebacterium otitidis]KKO84294.1 DNA-binding protein [Corynebacterium otitidis]